MDILPSTGRCPGRITSSNRSNVRLIEHLKKMYETSRETKSDKSERKAQ